MANPKAASRYAKSLLSLASERKLGDQVLADMETIYNSCNSSRELTVFLNSPVIKPYKKSVVLNEIYKGKLSDLSLQFINIIVRKGREMYLHGIAESYISQSRIQRNIVSAKLTTTSKVSPELRAKIMLLVKDKTGKEVELTEELNPDLIGGFVLRIGDQQLDESLSNKINNLKKEFSKNTYVRQF